jgi:hypothetical protein
MCANNINYTHRIVVRNKPLKNTGNINEKVTEAYNIEHKEKINKLLKYIRLENKIKKLRVEMYSEMKQSFTEDIVEIERKYPEMFI